MFKLDGFDFEIEGSASELDIDNDIFTLEVTSVQGVVDRVSELENHPWHWLIYAPKFYARDLVIAPESSGDFVRTLTGEDYETNEVALYAVEHLRVLPCTIWKRQSIIRVEGVVERGLLDREVPLEIEWDTREASLRL